ncbi:MAG: hypothetical protein IT460_18605 [Planctomycetes bacterium]|nr:hypothetical protein [Planctomycetota bacterium]
MTTTPPPSPVATGLASLPAPRRLAVGLFLVCLLGFYALAQVKLVVAAGGGSMPGPAQVLARYHGDPERSRLQLVLDPTRPTSDPKAMYIYLGDADEQRAQRHAAVLAWLGRGAPEEGWAEVEPVFTGTSTCGQCHKTGTDEAGNPRTKRDLPFETWEQVHPLTAPGGAMSVSELAQTSHNHLFGFAVASLLVSLVFTATRWRGPIVVLLVGGAFVGALLDVGGWWLTRAMGSPFQWAVIGGGALFGAALIAMVALSLDELWLGGVVGRVLRGRGGRAERRPPASS